MGRLIVIEGLDGSGKTTQTDFFTNYFQKRVASFLRVDFPDYESDSSALVKRYLAGEFGSDPKAVNPFAAASFYAVDRFAHFQTKWKKLYELGGLVLANRYTTANMVHQCSKLPDHEWDDFLDWLDNYEYKKLALPRPDLVIYLDLDPQKSQQLLSGRYQGDESKKDIHERDVAYLSLCRKAALAAAKRQGWQVIRCWEEDRLLTREEMHQKIFAVMAPYLAAWGLITKEESKHDLDLSC